jgi:Leucine-rich repeat (LRR) protein
MSTMPMATVFELRGNQQLTALPDWFGQLRTLRSLSLIDNGLTSLPPSFEQLKLDVVKVKEQGVRWPK